MVIENAPNMLNAVEELWKMMEEKVTENNIDSWGCCCHILELILKHSIFANTEI